MEYFFLNWFTFCLLETPRRSYQIKWVNLERWHVWRNCPLILTWLFFSKIRYRSLMKRTWSKRYKSINDNHGVFRAPSCPSLPPRLSICGNFETDKIIILCHRLVRTTCHFKFEWHLYLILSLYGAERLSLFELGTFFETILCTVSWQLGNILSFAWMYVSLRNLHVFRCFPTIV